MTVYSVCVCPSFAAFSVLLPNVAQGTNCSALNLRITDDGRGWMGLGLQRGHHRRPLRRSSNGPAIVVLE